MIRFENSIFCLEGESYSYLLRITKQGQLEHLHFGDRVGMEDVQALERKRGTGWGCSVLYSQEDNVCLDDLPLEWSGSGRGDYRESPVELGFATDFVYHGHEICDGSPAMASGLPQAHGAEQTLHLILAHGKRKLHLYYTVFPTAITRRTVLENCAEDPLPLRKLMSASVDLPGSFELTSFHGGWIGEMRPHKRPVSGNKLVNESNTGASSNQHHPGFLLSEPGAGEEHGRVYGFNLVYSGNHYASVQQSFQGLTRVMLGINPANFCCQLQPGECFETPEAVLCWSDGGFNGLSEAMHRFVSDHIVPPHWAKKPRPVLYNSWEGCTFDFDQRRLLDLAKRAKKLGCELFVLDDGWFGKRNDDKAGLGDYTVNKKKLPEGLKGLADRINTLGMEFGLWFEPEAVNPDSDLYRAHPDWALRDELPDLYGRNELLLDLTKPEVREYIVENVGATLDSANITYVKWDMNRHSCALGAKAHGYILGLYEILGRIFGPRKHILLESCSSGGNRFDLGMLCFSPQVWCSDDTDPIERLTIQQSLSYLYPQSCFGAHVSAAPHSQTLRTTPLSTRGNVSFFGCLGYELDLKHLVPTEEKEIAAQIAFYKQHREAFQFGNFRRIWSSDGIAWQVSRGDTVLAGLFHKLVSAAPGYEQLRLHGLKKTKRYHFASREQLLRVGQFGALVKYIAPVDLDPNGVVLRTADRHYAMKDGRQQLSASGAALMAGVRLAPRFTGAGYDPESRNQGDFSSNVYVVQEMKE